MPKERRQTAARSHRDNVQKQAITFNKDLGQHILKNPLVITSMIEKVQKKHFTLSCLLILSRLLSN